MKQLQLIGLFLMLTLQAHLQKANISDSLELVKLYNSTNGASWVNNNNWLTTNPIFTWFGIETIIVEDSVRVNEIDLPLNNLTGTIPNFNLPLLQNLNLEENYLTDTIPNFFLLPKLISLNLGKNIYLTGTIPNFNLPFLKYLNLWEDNLTGIIPNFHHLPELQVLDLSDNRLYGTIPNFSDSMPKLTALELNNNRLTGPIPNFNLPNLIILNLENNRLSGPINFNLPQIAYINVNENRFTFEGLEYLIYNFGRNVDDYSEQYTNLEIRRKGDTLSVSVGGTLANNTYDWYLSDQLDTTIIGDSTFILPIGCDEVTVRVKNLIATALTLLGKQLILAITYTFTGNGNWDDPSNWANNLMPPLILPSGSEIVINPAENGECILNVLQKIVPCGKITLMPGKKLILHGDLIIH